MPKFKLSTIGQEGFAFVYISEQQDTRRLKGAWEALIDFEGRAPGDALADLAYNWTHAGGGLYQYDPDQYHGSQALRDALGQYGIERLAMLAAKRRR